jgi:hypothetical protein
MIINLDKPISEKEAWDIIKSVYRELYDLTNAGNIQFASGSYNESMECTKLT